MPSHSLRLVQKICGLFDKGFAGSTAHAASFVVKAPESNPLATSTDSFLVDFEPSVVLSSGDPFYLHTLSAEDANAQLKNNLFVQPAADEVLGEWGELEDPLASLETDPLGEESLDAFINLDHLLTGDTFLDEVSEVKPVIEMTPQTSGAVISIPSPTGGDNQPLDFFDLLDCAPEVISAIQDQPVLSVIPTPTDVEPSPSLTATTKTANTAATSRKRKATSKPTSGPVKTSLFEIPLPISENVVSTTTTAIFTCPSSPQLDHDYTSKVFELPSTSAAAEKNHELVVEVDTEASIGVLDKQSIRRQKNNIASKRSREQRKQKFSDLDREAEELVVKNEALRKKIAELEKVAKEMKALLVAKMSGK